ncbi:MAG TPA: hypothetical protein VGN00_09210 [Puia sp.]|jgi:hypothetical protein
MLWGIPALLLSKQQLNRPHAWFRSRIGFLSFLFFAGALTLSAVATWWHLFQPLRFSHLLGLTLLLIIPLALFYNKDLLPFFPKKTARGSVGGFIFCTAAILLLLALSCLQTVNPDTHIYHLQIIQWSYKYPVVPGLANIFLRLGLGSAWFSLTSFFYLPGLANENFTYLNVTMSIWFLLWLSSQWNYHFHRLISDPRSRLLCFFYFLLLTYCILDWEILRNAANSANYDTIMIVCTLAGLCFLIEQLVVPDQNPAFSGLFVLLIVSTISYKISGILSLLLVAYHLIHHRPTKQQFSLVLLAALFILVPIGIKNYVITGYPLYPFTLSVTSPDWKVPKDLVIHLNHYITYTNRLQSFNVDITHSLYNNVNWIPEWFPQQFWSQQVLLLLALISTLLFFIRTDAGISHRSLRQLLAALFAILLVWLFTAPSPRFSLAPLLVAAILPLCLTLYKKINPSWYTPAFLIVSLICCIYGVHKANILVRSPQFLLHPANAETAPYRTVKLKDIDLHLVGIIHHNPDNRCYNTLLPCICQENPYLQPRGDSIRDGFRMTPYPDSAFIQNYKY